MSTSARPRPGGEAPDGGRGRSSDLEDDLRSTADTIALDAAVLARIEDEKSGLEVDDPRVGALSLEAEEVATRLLQEVRIERQLTDAAAQLETQTPSR